MAMVAVYRAMQQQDLKSKMILQVHDELVFDVHISEKDLMKKLVKEAMENAINLVVPMEVELQFGDNWLDAH
jgi:DNA polymerase-1